LSSVAPSALPLARVHVPPPPEKHLRLNVPLDASVVTVFDGAAGSDGLEGDDPPPPEQAADIRAIVRAAKVVFINEDTKDPFLLTEPGKHSTIGRKPL
jgi:hypothetical protein